MRLLLVCYMAGLLLGALGLIEWLVVRLVKLWASGFMAGLVVCVASAVFGVFVKMRRMIAR